MQSAPLSVSAPMPSPMPLLAGVAIGITGLAWKGFVYGPSVLFLVYAVQVVFNLFRSRDSTTLSTLFLAMTGTTLIMCVPYYGHPMIGTVFSGAGLLPLLFVIFFAIVAMIITTGYRDKPWTLLIGSGLVFTLVFFPLLWFLEQINFLKCLDNTHLGWRILRQVEDLRHHRRGQRPRSWTPVR